MIKAIIGTAGHVDHGKTALLKALTGIDCDRLPEEKQREITIDLGFAHLKTEDVQIGFIDVPGHERFLKNLLAGISGFQYFLFCIALDEGIKAQTIEHLKILKTLNLKNGIVALTKMDLIDDDLLNLKKKEVQDLFFEEGFDNIKFIPVSASSNKNINLLKNEIIYLVKNNYNKPNLEPPAILPIDRIFVIKGAGVVITGTLIRGNISLKDELLIFPQNKRVKIRSIEVHNEKRNLAEAVERVALQLAGLEKEDIKRGDILASEKLDETKIITIKLNLIKEIKENTRLRIAHHTNELFGKFHLINKDLGQIFLEEKIFALRGDKVVLRRFSPLEFFGAGEILDTKLEKIKSGISISLGDGLKNDISFWIKSGGIFGQNLDILRKRAGYINFKSLESLIGSQNCIFIENYVWEREEFEKLKNIVFEKIENFKNKYPKSFSLPLQNLFVFLKLNEKIQENLCKILNLKVERGNLILKEKENLEPELEILLNYWKEMGLEQKNLKDISEDLKINELELKKILRELVLRGFLVQVSVNYYVENNVLKKTIEKLKKTNWEKFSISEFKELFSIARKYAIPLLEYLDSKRITVRSKDFRILKIK